MIRIIARLTNAANRRRCCRSRLQFFLFDFSYGFVDGIPLDAKSPAEAEAERRRQKSDYDNTYELCRKFGQPPPCPPWGVPRSRSPEQERAESDANARWRWMMHYGPGLF